MNCPSHHVGHTPAALLARRWFLQECGIGLGGMALAELLGRANAASAATATVDPLAAKPGHFAGRAKSVIFLFMAGRRVTWNCSTTSPSWPDSTARCLRPNC